MENTMRPLMIVLALAAATPVLADDPVREGVPQVVIEETAGDSTRQWIIPAIAGAIVFLVLFGQRG
jgi:hypothetical protein